MWKHLWICNWTMKIAFSLNFALNTCRHKINYNVYKFHASRSKIYIHRCKQDKSIKNKNRNLLFVHSKANSTFEKSGKYEYWFVLCNQYIKNILFHDVLIKYVKTFEILGKCEHKLSEPELELYTQIQFPYCLLLILIWCKEAFT